MLIFDNHIRNKRFLWIAKFVAGHCLVLVPLLVVTGLLLGAPISKLLAPFLWMFIPALVSALMMSGSMSGKRSTILPLYLSLSCLIYLVFLDFLAIRTGVELGKVGPQVAHTLMFFVGPFALLISTLIYFRARQRLLR